MILLQSPSRFVLQTLQNRVLNSPEKGIDLDCHSFEFDDVRYHIQFSMKSPEVMLLSMSLPTPPPEAVFVDGLPIGALEAVKAVYGQVVQILDPPKDGFNITMKLNLSKLPPDEDKRHIELIKIASVRDVVLGAPLRMILKNLALKTVPPAVDDLVALVHRPKESFFLLPKEFVEARRTPGLNNAPLCTWSPSPPTELGGAPAEALDANGGFFTFVIFPRHVEGRRLDRTAWSLSTFHAYVSYHVKCSEGFMHTRMRRRVESLIQALDRAKPDAEKSKEGNSFKRLSIKDARNNSHSR